MDGSYQANLGRGDEYPGKKCFSLASTMARLRVHTLGLTLSLLSRLDIDVLHFVTKKKQIRGKAVHSGT